MKNTNSELEATETRTPESKSQLSIFEETIKPFLKEGYPVRARDKIGTFYVLKPEYAKGNKEPTPEYAVILEAAKKVNAKVPPAGFIVDYDGSDTSTESFYLHESDIEDGGPQPRTKIDINDPKIQELYQSIDKYGQLDPCKAYPSPTTPGKYRLRDGHCRRFIIFSLLRQPVLWVVSQKRSEKQVHFDAFILNNNRNNLSAYDKGHYIVEDLIKNFPDDFPNQEAIAKKLGISQNHVSEILSAYNTINSQKGKLDESIIARAIKIPEKTLRPIHKISEELKPSIITAITEHDLSSRQAEKLVNEVNADPDTTPEKVAVEAQRIKEQKAEDRAQVHMKEADKALAKNERARDKVVAAGEEYPKELMTAVYGHLGLKGKVTPEKAKVYASILVAVFFQKSLDKDELDEDLLQADLWA